MNIRNSVGWMGMVALLASGFFGFTVKAAVSPNSEPVWKVLLDARTMAFQLKDDARDHEEFRANEHKLASSCQCNQPNPRRR